MIKRTNEQKLLNLGARVVLLGVATKRLKSSLRHHIHIYGQSKSQHILLDKMEFSSLLTALFVAGEITTDVEEQGT